MHHRIKIITVANGKFAVTGAVSINSTRTPVQDAAKALREAGHPDRDTISISGEVASILPVSIGSILKPRKPPKAMYPGAPVRTYDDQ